MSGWRWWFYYALESAWFVGGIIIINKENLNTSLLCFVLSEIFAVRRQLTEKKIEEALR